MVANLNKPPQQSFVVFSDYIPSRNLDEVCPVCVEDLIDRSPSLRHRILEIVKNFLIENSKIKAHNGIHPLHAKCYNKVLEYGNLCPTCRAPIASEKDKLLFVELMKNDFNDKMMFANLAKSTRKVAAILVGLSVLDVALETFTLFGIGWGIIYGLGGTLLESSYQYPVVNDPRGNRYCKLLRKTMDIFLGICITCNVVGMAWASPGKDPKLYSESLITTTPQLLKRVIRELVVGAIVYKIAEIVWYRVPSFSFGGYIACASMGIAGALYLASKDWQNSADKIDSH